MFNDEGVRYIHERTKPLSVYSMDAAQNAIAKALEKGPSANITPEAWARHIAWIIGFDALIDDRKAINKITSLVVK